MTETPEAPDSGTSHLTWVTRFMLGLWGLGGALWLLRSWQASVAFLAGGAASFGFWFLHRWVVGGMLTPTVRRRWVFGFLGLGKLALIALMLRGIMSCFPTEAHSLVTGILLFAAGILLEAVRLIFRPGDTPTA